MSTQTPTLLESVVEYIGHSDAAMEQAASMQKAAAVKQAAAAAAIPACVEALVANGRITPAQREKAAEILQDHAKAVELLTKVASHRNADEQGALGKGVASEKTAADRTKQAAASPFVGGRRSSAMPSDHALYSGLGLAVPTEN